MVGIIDRDILRLMAGITKRIGVGVTIGMARLTLLRSVRPGERESSACMIPVRRLPGLRSVAVGAVGRKSSLGMRRAGRRCIQVAVTGVAIGWRRAVAIAVTGNAVQSCMCAGECKTRLIVIECTWLPRIRRMATSAVVREVVGLMVRLDHTGKICLMATETVGRRSGIAARVATLTGQRRVRADQRKAGLIVREC